MTNFNSKTAQVTQQINEMYRTDNRTEIISKTVHLLRMGLMIGMNTKDLTFNTIDLGIKPAELGISMAIALKQTDDQYLSDLDQKIKKIVILEHSKMLKELDV